MAPQELSQLRAIRVCLTKARSIFPGDAVLAAMLSGVWFISSMSILSAVLPYARGSACSNGQPGKLLGFLGASVGPLGHDPGNWMWKQEFGFVLPLTQRD